MLFQMSNETKLKTTINGIEYNLLVPSRLLASDFLRDNLNLTGTLLPALLLQFFLVPFQYQLMVLVNHATRRLYLG